MAQSMKCRSADELWALWENACSARSLVSERRQAVSDHWKLVQESGDETAANELWSQFMTLVREQDILSARSQVVWAHYIVAKYGLSESDVFDIE
jgi:hypothetical protein